MSTDHSHTQISSKPTAILLLIMSIIGLSSCSSEPSNQPDVILITLDTTRWDFLTSYGYKTPNSPNLDKLAAQGSRYLNAVTVTATTFPAHASMLSGLYPRSHGARSNFHRLGDDVTTVAQLLTKSNYQTGSFVSFKGVHYIGKLDRGFKSVSDPKSDGLKQPIRSGDITLEMATSWLQTTSVERPVFLWMHLFEPHSPYDITPWFKSNFPDYDRIFRTGVSVSQIKNAKVNNYSAQDIEAMQQIYAGEVHLADMYVGKLIASLKLRGNLDNTLVIITSDHGQGMGEDGKFGHGPVLWESALRVPLIIVDFRNPVPAVIDQRVGVVDITPTILEGVGLKIPTAVAGRSLYPLTEPTSDEDRLYFAEVKLIENPDSKTSRWYDRDDLAVYLGEYKMQQRKGKKTLFSTATDTNKLTPIAKKKAESLYYYLSDSIASYLENSGKAQSAELDTESLK